MDLEESRCQSQVNGSYSENRFVDQSYYNNSHEFMGYDEPELPLLTSCEFCNRTFLPGSLNKHKRGCYKSWLKVKERESKMSNDTDKGFITNGYQYDKPILTIEQMLAKRRQRRLNWRLRHEEFMRAVHAAREYAEAVASGNPLPPPPPPIVEPDLKQCPHCQRKFHEKAIERHIVRCKEQSIRNNKERPSYQTMEAKRRLAVRLYYQPNSRPNSCLSMSNSDMPNSFSRPSSRQTDFEYGRNVESSNSYNITRHSSLSVIDKNEIKKKLPSSVIENLNRPHERVTPRHSFKDFRTSQNNTPTFDYRISTPTMPDQYYGGRKSTMSMGMSRASSRQSMTGTVSEIEYLAKHHNEPQIAKQDSYANRRSIRRSTSCISQLRPSSNNKVINTSKENSTTSEIKICNHKPFSCNRSNVKDQRMSKEMSKSNSQINKISDIDKAFSRNKTKEIKQKSTNKNSDITSNNGTNSRSSSVLEKSEVVSHRSSSRIVRGKNELRAEVNVGEVSTKISHKSKHSNHSRKEIEKQEEIIIEKNRLDNDKSHNNERRLNKPNKVRAQQYSKLSNSDISLNSLKTENIKSTSTENLKLIAKTQSSIPVSGNRVRNEVQIRIKPHTKSETAHKVNEEEQEISKKGYIINAQQDIKESIRTKINNQQISEKSKPYSFQQIDSKGESPCLQQSSFRYVSNCSLSKAKEQAQGDSTLISPKVSNNDFEEIKHPNIQPLNLYQCKTIKSVSISDQNNIAKFKSTISLQDSLNRPEENVSRKSSSKAQNHFCHDCGHKFPAIDAKFCCSCGSKRSEIMLQK